MIFLQQQATTTTTLHQKCCASHATAFVMFSYPFLTSLFKNVCFPTAGKLLSLSLSIKKGDIYYMHNYHMIFLLNLFGKVFEKIICYQEESSELSQAQHSFRKRRSCETALIQLTNLLFTAQCAKCHTVLATIDFLCACDSMSFSHLLNVLTSHGLAD